MSKKIIYRSNASTKKEAEAEAIRLLEQVVETGERFQTVTKEYTNIHGESSDATVVILPSGMDAPAEDTPIVYIHRDKQETPEKEGSYWLYLLFDRKRLPFIYRCNSDLGELLGILRPTIRPEEPLPVEAILTKDGADTLEAALENFKDYTYSEETDAVLQEAKDAPKELRIYAFFDSLGRSLQEVKEDLEEGTFEVGAADGEIVLNTLTGKTFKTEKAYLKALGDFAGAVEVEKYKEQLLESYGWYKAYRFVHFLLYELLWTEDYSVVESKCKEYASAVGFKEEYMKYLTKGGEEYGSALEYALAIYMDKFLRLPFIFGGLNEMRMAEYMKIPKATLQKILTETQERSLL